jgi:hypothetical protein
MRNFLIFGLFFCFIGCAHTSHQIIKPFVEPVYGMTKPQMIDMLGTPDTIEIYKKTDLTQVEYYFYHRDYQSSRLKVPVCLVNNKVVGWGKSFYEDHVSSDDTRIK